MGAAQLPADGAVEHAHASPPHRPVRAEPDRLDVAGRPVAAEIHPAVALTVGHMGRRQAEDVAVEGGRVFGVIEHEEVGELLLAQESRGTSRQREQAFRQGGKGEAVGAMPHHHVEARMDRARGGASGSRGFQIAAAKGPRSAGQIGRRALPGGQENARIRPASRPAARCRCRREVVAVVEPQVGGDHRAARAAPRLAVELVLGRHAHQHMDEPEVAGDHDIGAIGSVQAKCVRNPLEIASRDCLAVEAQQPCNRAHARRAASVVEGSTICTAISDAGCGRSAASQLGRQRSLFRFQDVTWIALPQGLMPVTLP